ncbi:succinyl-diaminopimelate desuccinylase [Telmatospirillum sp.]|uniref:succinyl-diaminopimelate desuccinylase n=1 Tax=Telmatospirillum sp. TaxID=2079197 RepID=UPI002841F5DB|nr:succinyl-diaminopimelate desuccinylase [Telmatospirillum sp.]MDR3439196.1 succinyl-diaminopimelate desuccinylase [Telmatospirillum sp.]
MNRYADPLPLAQALIRRPSVTPADDGAIAVLQESLTELGFTCTRLSFGADAGRPPIENLYARLGHQGTNICFAGHTDVVPVGQGWSVDPFAGTVADGHLYGRGASDMKGAIACFVAAVARLQHEAGPLSDGSISLLITGDEEGRGLDGTIRVLDWLRRKGERLDLCLVGEPTNPRRLGEMIKIGRRGSLNGRLRVLGSQGHVAYPHLADNPLPRLIDMLKAITAHPLDDGTEHFQPSTLALTSIDVGNAATNVIPAEGRAAFNIRFNDRHSGKSLEQWLRERFDSVGGTYELDVEVTGDAFLTPPGSLSKALSDAIIEVTGESPELSTSGGTSDARFIKDACPVAEFGLVGQTMHKADERVSLTDLEALTRIYRRVLALVLGMTC